MKKVSKVLANAALMVTKKRVNSACSFFMGQRKLPKNVEKLKER